eukprot:1869969-Prymnesium_polylepis.2
MSYSPPWGLPAARQLHLQCVLAIQAPVGCALYYQHVQQCKTRAAADLNATASHAALAEKHGNSITEAHRAAISRVAAIAPAGIPGSSAASTAAAYARPYAGPTHPAAAATATANTTQRQNQTAAQPASPPPSPQRPQRQTTM